MFSYLNTSFDYNADEFIQMLDELPFWSAPFGIELLDHINYKQNIKALDIGFGAGFPLTEIAMRLGNSSKVYGIDPWEAAIKRAKQRIAYYNIQNVEILKGVAEKIPLANNSIDLITSNNGLNNVADLDKSLEECSRIAKKGGQFLQTMNLNHTMIEFYDVMQQVLESKKMDEAIQKMKDQIYSKRIPLEEILSKIKKNDFSVIKVIEKQFDYRFADGTALLNYYLFRMAFMEGWKSIVPEALHEEVFSAMEKRMNEIAKVKGCFKLSIPFVVIDCIKD